MTYSRDMLPSERPCFKVCRGCWKCSEYNQNLKKCRTCSNYFVDRVYDDCANGILRHKTMDGEFIMYPMTNPFDGKVIDRTNHPEDRAWDEYVAEQREKRNDPYWHPLQGI